MSSINSTRRESSLPEAIRAGAAGALGDTAAAQDEAELHQLLDPVKIAVIGPVTAETAARRPRRS